VNDETNIALVDAHAEGDGGADHLAFVVDPSGVDRLPK
jgi:hypothetical protein